MPLPLSQASSVRKTVKHLHFLLLLAPCFLLFSCKKTASQADDPETQIRAIVADYPNLRIVSFTPAGSGKISESTAGDLQVLKDTLAAFSALVKAIHVIPRPAGIIPPPIGSPKRNITNSTDSRKVVAGGNQESGSYTWQETIYAGSSEYAYTTILYTVSIGYTTTLPASGAAYNSITSASTPSYSGGNTSQTQGGTNYTYTWSAVYTENAASSTSTPQAAMFSWSGTVALSKTTYYHGAVFSTSGASQPIGNSGSVEASSLPILYIAPI